jgi:hypothetical protein
MMLEEAVVLVLEEVVVVVLVVVVGMSTKENKTKSRSLLECILSSLRSSGGSGFREVVPAELRK